MTTTAVHPVAPEEVMAWLDGELAADEAQAVAAHLEECGECAGVAAQFRGMSEQLAGWSVEEVPARVEAGVMAADGGRRRLSRGQRWIWWGVGMGGAVTAVVLLLVAVSPRSHQGVVQSQMYLADKQQQNLEELSAGPANGPPQDAQIAAVADAPASAAKAASQMAKARAQSGEYLREARSIGGGGGAPSPVVMPVAPMIARSVSLTMRVKDVADARPALEALLARHHGYMAQMNASTAEGGPRGFTASLRIPAGEMAAALKEVRALGQVENESQNGEEVTQQHQDLVARLKNARETEERFQTILQQRTGRVSDVLEVEEEIARVRGEIESMEAEQAALEHRVDFASVEVTLSEEYKAQFASPDSVGTRVRNAFVAGYRNAWETVLGMVLFLEEFGPTMMVWGILLALPGVWVWRRYRRMLAE
jgi:hypothetical protein